MYYIPTIQCILNDMHSIMKFNFSNYGLKDTTKIPIQLENDIKHVYTELNGL